MNRNKMAEWIVTHNNGTSSRAMWAGLMGVKPFNPNSWKYDIPYDSADLEYCIDLVEYCEVEPDKDFPSIIAIFPWFEPITRRWSELCRLYYLGQRYKNFETCNKMLLNAREESYDIRKSKIDYGEK